MIFIFEVPEIRASEMKGLSSIVVLTSGLLIFGALAPAWAQFDVSPAEFTIENVPVGEAYGLEMLKNLVIRNYENIPRVFILTVIKPPENAVRPGYKPIPDNRWLILQPPVVEIPGKKENEESSSAVVRMILDIPAREDLTNQKWEVWIQVERVPKPELGETIAVREIARMKLITRAEVSPRVPVGMLAILLVIIVVVAVLVALLAWMRRRPRRRRGR